MPGALPCELVPAADLLAELRAVKDPEELEIMIAAQRIAEKALTDILNEIRPGVTEKEIAARLQYLMLHYGAEDKSFDPIVVSGPNGSLPHGVPSEKGHPGRGVRHHGLRLHLSRLLLRHDPYRGGGIRDG